MKYIRKCILILIIGILALSGCSRADGPERDEEASSKIQIGFALDSKVMERWVTDIRIFTSTAHKYGAEVDVQIANGNVKRQVEQIDQFIEERKDVIVVVASDCHSLTKVIGRVKEAGIKVICYDRLVADIQPDLFVSFDYIKVGELMGEMMVHSLDEGSEVLMVSGPQSDSNSAKINLGFKKKIKEKNLKVVKKYEAESEDSSFAFKAVNEALDNYSGISGIMCGSDAIASEVIKALSERKLVGEILVTGQNADIEACQKIVEGQQTMTVFEDFEELAKVAAENAVILAEDMEMGETQIEKNGEYRVPAIYLEPVKVTKRNIDKEIIERGFHLKEDIYLHMEN